MSVRNRTPARRVNATPPVERLAYALCGAALVWSLLSLIGWWHLSDTRERYETWRYVPR